MAGCQHARSATSVPELLAAGFAGTLCSEWGGHAWLDDDPAVMTTRAPRSWSARSWRNLPI